jgi:hypothetical protein
VRELLRKVLGSFLQKALFSSSFGDGAKVVLRARSGTRRSTLIMPTKVHGLLLAQRLLVGFSLMRI